MIDVSSYQQAVDWSSVKRSGIERAYIKMGEDHPGGIDPYAVLNLHHARAAGVQVGVYWFAHPQNTPAESSSRFLSLAHGHLLPGDLPPALDLEVDGGLSLAQLDWWKGRWFQPVDSAIGTRATFYSFRYYLNAFHFFDDRPIWGAHPGGITDAERARWSFWQYGEGRVPGISGLVDFDEALGTVPVIPPAV
jgi:lysozyme